MKRNHVLFLTFRLKGREIGVHRLTALNQHRFNAISRYYCDVRLLKFVKLWLYYNISGRSSNYGYVAFS